ncbi:hypothetical protein [Pedobacter frigidisoli]|uniref:hypothetical protein n=1 Tax=Pedobacter frigidisoli TaxID=2530455 RepID=UPI00292E7A5D|nr:hypothetical protein [Pedobacter frigidisoli]
MKTLLLQLRKGDLLFRVFLLLLLVSGLTTAWRVLPLFLGNGDATVGWLDAGIWQLAFFSLICWFCLLLLSLGLLNILRKQLALPSIYLMVSQFKNLPSWQQLSFYYACFALLLLSAVGCLAAVF